MAKEMVPLSCPVCGSFGSLKNVGEERTRFSAGKAVAGAVLFGPIGLAGGAFGNKKYRYVCSKCGFSKLYDL